MSQRIGVDLVPLARIRPLLAAERREVLERMLRPDEISNCRRGGRLDVPALAGRIAAKEAVFKLLREDGVPLPWLSIGVSAKSGTWPKVALEGEALSLAQASGIQSDISVSISHDGDYAVAAAVCEIADPVYEPSPPTAD
ncbi:holo-[acyl-carrier protein] synthase [Spinactinospora alkalitolerans]|uniref:Holo-[acyl-carrier-protein] synthase n=1 Tax=Spinactinospora alkalitolerans TaxID=687207 RepID=A0A852U9G5_9ACTN|nr:4'-phosphopantetheinyl transferase superfamily protein [Spinactinospora alkalitolerans]NYE50590.1 holo-[acyl-carrier protein] synthase [Spinactinospora alkalitolerans]